MIQKKEESLLKNFVIGAMAGSSAAVFSNPFDCAKTRLQLQGELMKTGEYQKKLNGVVDTLIKTYKYEGIRGIQSGLLTAIYFQTVMNGLRLGIYESGKALRHEDNKKSHAYNMLTGLCAGFTGSFTASPLQLVKTRQQANSFAAERHRYQYKSVLEALTKIFQLEGVKGLYHGAVPFAMRTGVGSAAQLATYDKIKHIAVDNFHLKDDGVLYVFSSFVASFAASFTQSPWDVVSTRVYNQKYSQAGGELYKGPWDCFIKILKIEGVAGLYKGFFAMWSRMAPHTMLFFAFTEYFKGIFAKY